MMIAVISSKHALVLKKDIIAVKQQNTKHLCNPKFEEFC